MYKIINQSKRSFIVKATEVLKGGEKHPIKGEMVIAPGTKVYEVTDELGKILTTYSDILVVETTDPDPVKRKRK